MLSPKRIIPKGAIIRVWPSSTTPIFSSTSRMVVPRFRNPYTTTTTTTSSSDLTNNNENSQSQHPTATISTPIDQNTNSSVYPDDLAHLTSLPTSPSKPLVVLGPYIYKSYREDHEISPDTRLFYDALRKNDGGMAWKVYRKLYQEQEHEALQSEDHTRLLQLLTIHPHPRIASIAGIRIWKNMVECGHKLDRRDYKALMTIFLRNGDLRRVVHVWETMTGSTSTTSSSSSLPSTSSNTTIIQPDTKSYNILLSAYAHYDDLENIVRVFSEMSRNLPTVNDPETWAILIHAYGKTGNGQGSKDLWHQMDRLNITKTPMVYEAMMRALISNGEAKQAIELFESLQQKHQTKESTIGPEIETYDALFEAYEVENDLTSAESVWNRVWSNPLDTKDPIDPEQSTVYGITFLTCTFNRMITLYGKHGQVDKITQIWKQLQKLKRRPTTETYTRLVKAYLECKEMDKALLAYDEMLEKGFAPSLVLIEKVNRAKQGLSV